MNSLKQPECLNELIPEIPAPNEDHSRLETTTRLLKTIGRGTVALFIGIAGASLVGDTTVETEHLEAQISTEVTSNFSGDSSINTPGFNVDYPTHSGPLGLELTVEDLYMDKVISTLADGADDNPEKTASPSSAIEEEGQQIKQAASEHSIKYLSLLGVFTAAGYIATSKRGRLMSKDKILQGVLAGGLAVSIPLGIGFTTWDSDAFDKPTYSGNLATAFKNADIINELDEHDERISEQAQYLIKLVETIEQQNSNPSEDIAVRGLVVSDIHQRNPYPIVKQIIDNYDASFVIDSGDIVDWGSPFENGFFLGTPTSILRENKVGIPDLGVPYYFAAGNHDSPQRTVLPLSRLANVRILELGDSFQQNGLVITGAKDPVFTPSSSLSKDERRQAQIETGTALQQQLKENPADIAVVHNPTAGEQITEGTQLRISGDTHEFKYLDPLPINHPAYLNTASSGGVGLRNFNNPLGEETPQTFTLINFGSNCRLVSIDKITITSLEDDPEFNVRHIPVNGSVDPGLYEGRSCQ